MNNKNIYFLKNTVFPNIFKNHKNQNPLYFWGGQGQDWGSEKSMFFLKVFLIRLHISRKDVLIPQIFMEKSSNLGPNPPGTSILRFWGPRGFQPFGGVWGGRSPPNFGEAKRSPPNFYTEKCSNTVVGERRTRFLAKIWPISPPQISTPKINTALEFREIWRTNSRTP